MSNEDLPAWRWFDRKGQRGKGLERFVTAIHTQEESGAEVRWSEKIQGREFDATIRHTGGDQSRLTVIECKDLSKRVSVNAVEAFVTKAADANASRAIIVSAKGFQRGAIAVAKRHRVELWTLSEFTEKWPTRVTREPIEAINIRNVQFIGAGRARYLLADDERQALHRVSLVLAGGSQVVSFNNVMARVQANVLVRLRETAGARLFRIPMAAGSKILFPHESPLALREIVFEAEIIPAVQLQHHIMPPEVKVRGYEYGPRNATKTFKEHDFGIGFDTELKPGAFYRNIWGFRYKCIAVEGNEATMMLLASSQHGHELSVEFRMDSKHADGYVAIDDPGDCRELENTARILESKKEG